jgi:hypothetical protein
VRRGALLLVGIGIAGTVALVLWAIVHTSSNGSSPRHRRTGTTQQRSEMPAPNLVQPGSDPTVLPGPLLVADRGNNRLLEIDPHGKTLWEFPRPGDLAPGETFNVPDDAFFSPDGKQIIATQEDDFVITVIDINSHHIAWRYGTPGQHGSGPNQLWNPDDALILPTGDVLTADIKNCRLLLIPSGGHAPSRVFGQTTQACRHAPPARFGSPNGAFPMSNGHYVVTEINGDWIDEIDLNANVYLATHPPGVQYPSDTNEVSPGIFLTADYSQPGAIETFDPTGHLLWRFAPTGADALNKPSLALPLPNGDVLANDDYNHRVMVIDPRTSHIVWQYGQTGAPGNTPGLLQIPDGVDLAPPYSLAITHAPTMGHP